MATWAPSARPFTTFAPRARALQALWDPGKAKAALRQTPPRAPTNKKIATNNHTRNKKIEVKKAHRYGLTMFLLLRARQNVFADLGPSMDPLRTPSGLFFISIWGPPWASLKFSYMFQSGLCGPLGTTNGPPWDPLGKAPSPLKIPLGSVGISEGPLGAPGNP